MLASNQVVITEEVVTKAMFTKQAELEAAIQVAKPARKDVKRKVAKIVPMKVAKPTKFMEQEAVVIPPKFVHYQHSQHVHETIIDCETKRVCDNRNSRNTNEVRDTSFTKPKWFMMPEQLVIQSKFSIPTKVATP